MEDNKEQEEFLRAVDSKARRMLRLRRTKELSLLGGFAQMGLVGWSIAAPSLLGLFLGWLIDNGLNGGQKCTLTLFIIGLGFGCCNVLSWACKEYKAMEEDECEPK